MCSAYACFTFKAPSAPLFSILKYCRTGVIYMVHLHNQQWNANEGTHWYIKEKNTAKNNININKDWLY